MKLHRIRTKSIRMNPKRVSHRLPFTFVLFMGLNHIHFIIWNMNIFGMTFLVHGGILWKLICYVGSTDHHFHVSFVTEWTYHHFLWFNIPFFKSVSDIYHSLENMTKLHRMYYKTHNYGITKNNSDYTCLKLASKNRWNVSFSQEWPIYS